MTPAERSESIWLLRTHAAVIASDIEFALAGEPLPGGVKTVAEFRRDLALAAALRADAIAAALRLLAAKPTCVDE